jgi:hypothetical protein
MLVASLFVPGVAWGGVHPVEMVLEGIEARAPQRPVRGDPGVDLLDGLGSYPVQALLGGDASFDQSDLSQDPKVLRYSRLAHGKGPDQLTDRAFPVAEQIEDLSPAWLGQGLERRHHGASMPQ